MKTIYKYRLPFMEVAKVEMPADAKILRVDGVDGALWLWAIVDTESPLVVREFHLFKTGSEMPDDIDAYYYYLGGGAIFIQMELFMYVFEDLRYVPAPAKPLPKPFQWMKYQEMPSVTYTKDKGV